MGRNPWASGKQKVWLKGHIPQYRDGQRRHKLGDFFETTRAAFFKTFPLILTTGDDPKDRDENFVYAPSVKVAKDV